MLSLSSQIPGIDFIFPQIKNFKNLNSLHIVYYEEPIKKSSNTKKIYIRNRKLKRKEREAMIKEAFLQCEKDRIKYCYGWN